jgi:hypothetical protein
VPVAFRKLRRPRGLWVMYFNEVKAFSASAP